MAVPVSTSPLQFESAITDCKVDQLNYLWDEYKYRHELCWHAVYKVTAAVVALDIVPYVGKHLMDRWNWCLLFPSVLGIFLAWFSLRLIQAEFLIWNPVRKMYNSLQRQYCSKLLGNEIELTELKGDFDNAVLCKQQFEGRVTLFLQGLFCLSVANCLLALAYFVWPSKS